MLSVVRCSGCGEEIHRLFGQPNISLKFSWTLRPCKCCGNAYPNERASRFHSFCSVACMLRSAAVCPQCVGTSGRKETEPDDAGMPVAKMIPCERCGGTGIEVRKWTPPSESPG